MPRIEDELVMAFPEERQKALLNILFTANWIRQIDVARLLPYSISPQQYNILRILRGVHPERVRMNDVKARMLDRSPNATRLSDKLIAKGLVERERCAVDRRVVFMRITDPGLALLERVDRETEKSFEFIRTRLSPTDAEQINLALDKIRG